MNDLALPENWKAVPLGSLGIFFRGQGGTRSDESDNGLPCIRYGDIYTHHDCVVKSFCSAIEPERASSYTLLQPGDVVFAASGETFEEIGKAAAYCGQEKVYAGGDTVIFRPSSNLDSYFAGYAVNSDNANKHKSRLGQGSSVIHISAENLASIPLQLPPINQQQTIANILQIIDRAITHTEALIEKYQQIKAGLMQDLFTRGIGADGKLRPPREEAPELYQESAIGWIPREWDVFQISELAAPFKGSTVIGPFGSDLVMTDYRSEGTPVVFVRDVKEDQFNWVSNVFISNQKTRMLFAHRVNGGDLLATKMGLPPCLACVYPEDMPMGIITADMIRMTVDRNKADPVWLSAAINHDKVKRQVAAITAGVTRPKVTLADFRNLKIATPSHEEQLIISSMLNKQKKLISSEEEALVKLQKQKSGLMHDLLTGKVPVNVDADEVDHV